jgi:hypothetical protein
LFVVALALGKTVREIEDSMPATELAEWIAFYNDSPFGEYRADLRAGIVSTVIARTQGNTTAKPSDFMPEFIFGKQTAKGPAPSRAALEAAQVSEAFIKASSKLRHHVIRRKAKDGGNGIAR